MYKYYEDLVRKIGETKLSYLIAKLLDSNTGFSARKFQGYICTLALEAKNFKMIDEIAIAPYPAAKNALEIAGVQL